MNVPQNYQQKCIKSQHHFLIFVSGILVSIACKMHSNLKYFIIFLFFCVRGYKITSVPNVSNDDNYPILITNQSYDLVSTNEFKPTQIEYQRKSSSFNDENDIRSEALLKQIHPFVFPKQFNVLDRLSVRDFNATKQNLMEIRNFATAEQNSERIDDSYGPNKHSNDDIMPLAAHLSKHGQFNYGHFDRPHDNQVASSNGHNCLLGLLNGNDLSLLLLGILGFVAYVLNAVFTLIDQLNLTLLAPTMAGMTTSPVTNATPITKTLFTQRQNIDDRTIENHQRVLNNFDRILQIAIEVFEQKLNSVQ